MKHANSSRAALVVLGLVVASCGRGADRETRTSEAAKAGDSQPAAAAPTGACGYISEEDASSALDQPSRYRRGPPSTQACTVEPASGDVFHGTTVEYRLTQGSTAQYDFIAAQKPAQPISGLGDRALWLPAGETRGNLVVVRGSTIVNLIITDLDRHGDLQKRARSFAKKVLERI
jgi:hypothetical protein